MMRRVEQYEQEHGSQQQRTAPDNGVSDGGCIVPAHGDLILHYIERREGNARIKFEACACMATVAPLNWGRIVLSGVLAGIVGGICFVVFIYAAHLLPAHASALAFWQYVASTAFGKAAFASPAYKWAGGALLFAACIGWAIGYAYLAQTKRAINKQPIISGFIFGVIVYVVMQFVLFSVQALKMPSILSVYLGILSTTVFFGIPVAFTARVK
jgi:hypothetical protein